MLVDIGEEVRRNTGTEMKLYSYWRSSASFRVRIALNLKDAAYDIQPINLEARAQKAEAYLARNPEGLVPALELDDGTILTQSLAIIDWLEASFPTPALIPKDPTQRARVLAVSHAIAMNIQPLCNSGTINHLAGAHDFPRSDTAVWMHHWMKKGLGAVAALIEDEGPFCFGSAPGLADICLIPQLYNARRWDLDISAFRRLSQIEEACLSVKAFQEALPERQVDASHAKLDEME